MIIIKDGKYTTRSDFRCIDMDKIDKSSCVNADIGDDTKIYCHLILYDKVHIAINNAFIGKGMIMIGEGSTIGPNCVFYTSMPDRETGATNKYVEGHKPIIDDIIIGKNVFIGTNSVIGCGVKIDNGVWLPPFSHIKPFTHVKR